MIPESPGDFYFMVILGRLRDKLRKVAIEASVYKGALDPTLLG